MLKAGQIIRFTKDDPQTWEVLRVNQCAATVRCTSKRPQSFVTREDVEVEFDAPGKRTTISSNSMVEIVEDVPT